MLDGWCSRGRHTWRKSCAAETATSSPACSRACWTSIWSAALLSKTPPSSFRLRSAAPLCKQHTRRMHTTDGLEPTRRQQAPVRSRALLLLNRHMHLMITCKGTADEDTWVVRGRSAR